MDAGRLVLAAEGRVRRREPLRVLCADPPWAPKDKLPGASRGAASNYDTLSVNEIARYPLPPIADAALLFLWRLSSMPEEALFVAKAWGFMPKTEICWVKTSLTDTKLHIGMGRILRGAHETCLVCARGKYAPDVIDKGVRTVLIAPVTENDEGGIWHSAKPPAFYDVVEKVYPAPWGELFARTRRPGWQQWGRDLPGGAEHP